MARHHLSLSPANLFIASDSAVRITDFCIIIAIIACDVISVICIIISSHRLCVYLRESKADVHGQYL